MDGRGLSMETKRKSVAPFYAVAVVWLGYALLFPLMIVFCLPRMHERYFYLADAMAIAAAAEDRRMTLAAGLIALASLGSYWETALPLSACAWMMFAAGIWTIGHTQREENML